MADVHRAVDDARQEQEGPQAAPLGVGNQGTVVGPRLQVAPPIRHAIQAQLTEGVVEVQLEPGGIGCIRRGDGDVARGRSQILSVVAAGLGRRRRRRPSSGQRAGIGDGRGGVGHRQHGGDPAGEGGGGRARPVLFVGLPRVAGVHVDVDESGEANHRQKKSPTTGAGDRAAAGRSGIVGAQGHRRAGIVPTVARPVKLPGAAPPPPARAPGRRPRTPRWRRCWPWAGGRTGSGDDDAATGGGPTTAAAATPPPGRPTVQP